ELLPATPGLGDPLPRELPRADLLQQVPHLRPTLLANHPVPGDVVTPLSRVAHAVAHPLDTAGVDQVDDQLHLMQALEIRQLRRVTRLGQRVESRLDQRAQTPAQHRLLTEEIRLRLVR